MGCINIHSSNLVEDYQETFDVTKLSTIVIIKMCDKSVRNEGVRISSYK